MSKPIRTKIFKSGNSKAVRLPSSFAIEAGTEVTLREERGRYIIEPVAGPRLIDLTGIAGSMPTLRPLPREDFDDPPRDWHLLGVPDAE
jgi:antitoxin VapB